jgi:hypothetical protein
LYVFTSSIAACIFLLPLCHHSHPPPPTPPSVAFRIYDIKGNGRIERGELRRFLVALMADNPDVDLDRQALDDIVEDVRGRPAASWRAPCMRRARLRGLLLWAWRVRVE